MANRKVINARVANGKGMDYLKITYDDGKGEVTYYCEPSDYPTHTIEFLDLDELIGLDEEYLYLTVRSAMLY